MARAEGKGNAEGMTVSEVAFILSGVVGKCSHCGRDGQPLGTCNANLQDDVRCIDCFFNIPSDYWDACNHCGVWGPPEICSSCGKPQHSVVSASSAKSVVAS
jgi:hypothetical protein